MSQSATCPAAVVPLRTALAPSSAERGIIVTDGGVVMLPDGPNEKHTRSLARLLAKSKKNQLREDFRFYRQYYEFVGSNPADPLAFERDGYEAGVARIKAALEAADLVVTLQTNLSNSYDVTTRVGYPNYLGRYPRRIRVLYAQWIEDGLHPSPENPAEVPGWWKMGADARLLIANATIKNEYGREYAGMRFVVKGRQTHAGRPQNPAGVADEMTEAITTSDAPEVIKVLTTLYHDEASRVNSLLPASGLGWALADFGDTIFVRQKWGGEWPDLAVGITTYVRGWLLDRFASIPHPGDPSRTMMAHMRELLAAGNYDGLDRIVLFASDKTGDAYSRSGFRYWFQDAMIEGGVKAGSWTPSPHFYRNCRMHDTVTTIFRETKPGPERTRRLNEAAQDFGHHSTCWKNYVRFAFDMESRRIRRERAEQRRREREARANGVPPPPRSPNLADAQASALHAGLPSRALA